MRFSVSLVKRSKIYYARILIGKAYQHQLGKKEIWKSTYIQDRRLAEVVAYRYLDSLLAEVGHIGQGQESSCEGWNVSSVTEQAMTLGELFKKYTSFHAGQWSLATSKSYKKFQRVFLLLLGADTPCVSIRKRNLLELRDLFRKLPTGVKIRSKEDFYAAIDSDASNDILSTQTINAYFRHLKGALNWAELNDLIEQSPLKGFRDLKVITTKDARKPLSSSEITIVFKYLSTENMQGGCNLYYCCLLLLFTGMRLSEVCKLRVQDLICEDGRYYFRIEELYIEGTKVSPKTRNGNRVVPLHSELLRLGLVDFVNTKSHPQGFIFEDAIPSRVDESYSYRYSKRLNRIFRIKLGLDQSKVVHSLRHNLRDAFRRVGTVDIEIIKSIFGWSLNKEGMSSYYGSGYELRELHQAMNLISYPDVKFSE